MRKKPRLEHPDFHINRASLNLKNHGLGFRKKPKNIKKPKKSKKPKDFVTLINKMSKLSFKSSKKKFAALKSNPYSMSGLKLWDFGQIRDKKPKPNKKRPKKKRKMQLNKMVKRQATKKPNFKQLAKLSKTYLNNSTKPNIQARKTKNHLTKPKQSNTNTKQVNH